MGRLAALGFAVLSACPGQGLAASRLPPSAPVIVGLRPCPDGGFALPGSTACVRLTGQVETGMVLRTSAENHAAGPGRSLSLRSHADGRFAVDVRMPTELGPLRIYTSVRAGPSPGLDVRR